MKMSEFARRRRQLMRMMGNGSIAIVPAAPERLRNRDVEYPYRQDSDLHYLTGFPEPETVAVLIPGRRQGEFVLFCRATDPEREAWTGPRAGQEGAVENFGADDSFPITDLDDILPGLLEGCERVFYTMGRDPEFDRRLIAWVNRIRENTRSGSRPPAEFISLDLLLHEMRLFKSAAELRMMRAAARISMEAHRRAMRRCHPGMVEYEVEAELLYHFRRHGAEAAYPPIVGGGANGCVLHYVRNDAPLQDGDLLLIDAGAELECYACDITRTFPVNGRFTPAQRAIYDLVLKAHEAAIAKVRPGNHWNDPHQAVVRVFTEGLVRLGLLKGRPAQLIKDGAYRRFYIHRAGHWLGLDVHDVGDYKVDGKWRLLEPGMVLTVEPGLYVPAGSKGVARKWWNIGVRIEDDVRVTPAGREVLTGGLIRSADAIEAWMAGGG
jgi:Xaa-Pro aminopeptidase